MKTAAGSKASDRDPYSWDAKLPFFVRKYTLASGGPYCDCGYKKTPRSLLPTEKISRTNLNAYTNSRRSGNINGTIRFHNDPENR